MDAQVTVGSTMLSQPQAQPPQPIRCRAVQPQAGWTVMINPPLQKLGLSHDKIKHELLSQLPARQLLLLPSFQYLICNVPRFLHKPHRAGTDQFAADAFSAVRTCATNAVLQMLPAQSLQHSEFKGGGSTADGAVMAAGSGDHEW